MKVERISKPFKKSFNLYSEEYKNFVIKRHGETGGFGLFLKDHLFDSIASFGCQWTFDEIKKVIDKDFLKLK